jgi:hypothetical protein
MACGMELGTSWIGIGQARQPTDTHGIGVVIYRLPRIDSHHDHDPQIITMPDSRSQQ